MFTKREEDIIIEEIRETNNELLLQHLVDKQGNRNGISATPEGSDVEAVPDGQHRQPVPGNE